MIEEIGRFMTERNIPIMQTGHERRRGYLLMYFRSIKTSRVESAMGDLSDYLQKPARVVKGDNREIAVAVREEVKPVKPREPRDGAIFLGEGPLRDFYYEPHKAPHGLVAGATGSGKSVLVHTVLCGILTGSTPAQWRLMLIDPKRVEFGRYRGVPHLGAATATKPEDMEESLRVAVRLMQRRFEFMQREGIRDWADSDRCRLLVVVDEIADLTATSSVAARLIQRLAQKGRAAGISLLLATQRPSTDVIPGTLKANIPTRIALQVPSATDSRVILDQGGAERLSSIGEALIRHRTDVYSIQTPYTTDDHIAEAVRVSKRSACTHRFYAPHVADGKAEDEAHEDNLN